MKRAVQLMFVGAVLALVSGIVAGLTTHNIGFITHTSSNTATVHNSSSLAVGVIGGIIDSLLWMWMTWKTMSGRGWARVLSTVFFGFSCLTLIGDITSVANAHTYLAFIVGLITWAVGLAAIIYLWKRESTEFFTHAKQAKLARAR